MPLCNTALKACLKKCLEFRIKDAGQMWSKGQREKETKNGALWNPT